VVSGLVLRGSRAAERFMAHFGGKKLYPKQRGKGRHWASAEVSAGSTTQIKNGIGRIAFNRIQKRRIVLADVVILSAIPVCLGLADRNGRLSLLKCDATGRHRPEVARTAKTTTLATAADATDGF
jgi:hypothetical protein